MKKLMVFLLTLVMTVALFAAPVSAEESGFVFSEWNPEAPALKALIEYVEDVTDEASPNYIPPSPKIRSRQERTSSRTEISREAPKAGGYGIPPKMLRWIVRTENFMYRPGLISASR